jgi:hypothetical protein
MHIFINISIENVITPLYFYNNNYNINYSFNINISYIPGRLFIRPSVNKYYL